MPRVGPEASTPFTDIYDIYMCIYIYIYVYINYVGHLRYPKGDELWPFEIVPIIPPACPIGTQVA